MLRSLQDSCRFKESPSERNMDKESLSHASERVLCIYDDAEKLLPARVAPVSQCQIFPLNFRCGAGLVRGMEGGNKEGGRYMGKGGKGPSMSEVV